MEKQDPAQEKARDSTTDGSLTGGRPAKGADTDEIREKFRIVKVHMSASQCSIYIQGI